MGMSIQAENEVEASRDKRITDWLKLHADHTPDPLSRRHGDWIECIDKHLATKVTYRGDRLL